MRFGILTRNRNSWSSIQLQESMTKQNIAHACFSLDQLIAHVGYRPSFRTSDSINPSELCALLVRPIGRGSGEELVFGMDVLYRLQRFGVYILNAPEAIEHCVDKYDVLAILEEEGLSVPRTAATENVEEALKAFDEIGGDVVVKPLFGSRGVGSTRVRDREIASSVFKAITLYHGVIYLQQYIPHGISDIRAFVVGDRVVAAMKRVAAGWKTNYSQGARAEPVEIGKTLEEMAVKSAKLLGCKVAGVDLLEGPNGPLLLEVNSQPGWKGLQSVTSTCISDEIVRFAQSELKR